MFPPPLATKTYTITLAFFANNASHQVNLASFDGVSYVEPPLVLLDLLNEGKPLPTTTQGLSAEGQPLGVLGFNMLTFPTEDVVEMIINNQNGGEHPIHVRITEPPNHHLLTSLIQCSNYVYPRKSSLIFPLRISY